MSQSPRRASLEAWFEQVDILLAEQRGRPVPPPAVPEPVRCGLRQPMALRQLRRSLQRVVLTAARPEQPRRLVS